MYRADLERKGACFSQGTGIMLAWMLTMKESVQETGGELKTYGCIPRKKKRKGLDRKMIQCDRGCFVCVVCAVPVAAGSRRGVWQDTAKQRTHACACAGAKTLSLPSGSGAVCGERGAWVVQLS